MIREEGGREDEAANMVGAVGGERPRPAAVFRLEA